MNIRKKALCAILAASLAVLSACAQQQNSVANNDTSATQATPASSETTAASTTASAAAETTTTTPAEEKKAESFTFRPGVWWAKGSSDGEFYYTFNDDGKTGELKDQHYGINVGFEYSLDGNSGEFKMLTIEQARKVEIVPTDNDTVVMKWDDGDTETLTYYGPADDFEIYSTTDLAEMARFYYMDKHDGNEPTQVDASIEDDGTINIQIYDDSSYSLNATAAWYFIDRFTAKGKDIDGREIDLAPYGEVNTLGDYVESSADTDVFGVGVWWAKDKDRHDAYYIFRGDNSGGVRNQDIGSGVAFDYELDGNKGVFHMGAVDSVSNVEITVTGEGTLTLDWIDSGFTEELTYIGPEEDFSFFSTRELEDMAKAYYAKNNDGYVPSEIASEIQDDDLIAIQLFDIVTDHTTTAAWYYINRFTGTGTDIMGNDVDLTTVLADKPETVVPAAWEPTVIHRQSIFDNDAPAGVLYLGWIDPAVTEFDDSVKEILESTGTTEDFPFTAEMPKDRFVSTKSGQELYLIIPLDQDGAVVVYAAEFGEDSSTPMATDILYSSSDGAPFLLKCNVSEIMPDVIVEISDSNGDYIYWSPSISGENGHVLTRTENDKTVYDFTDYGALLPGEAGEG